MEERELCYTIGGNVDWCRHQGKQYGIPQKTKNRIIVRSWAFTQTKLVQKDSHIFMFMATLFTIAKTWKQMSIN